MIATCFAMPKYPLESQRVLFHDLVDVTTGEVCISEVDASDQLDMGQFLRRSYRSHATGDESLGPGWYFGLNMWLNHTEKGWEWHCGNGNVIPYLANAAPQVRNIHVPQVVFTNTGSQELSISKIGSYRLGFQVVSDHRARLASLHMKDGQRYSCEYSDDHELKALQGEFDDRLEFEWSNGRLSLIRKIRGGQQPRPLVSYTYNEAGQLVKVGTVALGTLQYGYGKSGSLESVSLGQEKQVTLTYDGKNRCVMAEHGVTRHSLRFEYQETESVTTVTDGLKSTHTFHSSPQGHVERHEWNEDFVLVYQRDQYQRITRIHDSAGTALSLEFDQRGYCRKVLLPKTEEAVLSWSDDGALTEQNAFGIKHEFVSDESTGNSMVKQNGQMVWSQEWVHPGKERIVIDRRNRAYREHLNAHGQLIKMHHLSAIQVTGSPTNTSTETRTYNPEGNLASWRHRDEDAWQWEYGSAGRPIEIFLGDIFFLKCGYNADLKLTRVGDSLKRSVSWDSTTDGRLEHIEDAIGNVYQLSWGPQRRIRQITNPLQQSAFFRYDGRGNLLEFADYHGREFRYEYDIWGNLFGVTFPDKQSVTSQCDPLGRLLEVLHADGKTTYSYNSSGWPTRAETPSCTTKITWTENGALSSDEQHGRMVSYQRDPLGFPRERTTPSGAKCKYTWDKAYQLCRATFPGGQEVTILLDDHNREIQRWSPDGFVLRQKFDDKGNIQLQTAGSWEDKTFYSEDGPRKDIRATVKREYLFDSLGYLRAIRAPAASSWFTLDHNGRTVTARHDGSIRENLEYGPAGRIVQITRAFEDQQNFDDFFLKSTGHASGFHSDLHTPNVTYTWDARGRALTRKKIVSQFQTLEWEYRWDHLDRLVCVQTPKKFLCEYTYDGFGRRIEKRIGDRGKYFVWEGPLLAEETAFETWNQTIKTGATTTWFYLPNHPIPFAGEIEGQLHYLIADHQFAPRELVNSKGEIVWSARYTSTGGLIAPPGQEHQTLQCPFRRWGSYFDPESGLLFDGVRYFDPDVGRYLSPHPQRELGLVESGPHQSIPFEQFMKSLCPLPQAGDGNMWKHLMRKHSPLTDTDIPQLTDVRLKSNGYALWFEIDHEHLTPSWSTLLSQALQMVGTSTTALARIGTNVNSRHQLL